MMIFIIQSRAMIYHCVVLLCYTAVRLNIVTTRPGQAWLTKQMSTNNTAVKSHNSDSLQLPTILHLSKLVCEFLYEFEIQKYSLQNLRMKYIACSQSDINPDIFSIPWRMNCSASSWRREQRGCRPACWELLVSLRRL